MASLEANMKQLLSIISILSLSALLSACGKPEPALNIESVESLVANPDRLEELRAACKADHVGVGDAQCRAVAEATRQRFMRVAPSPYAGDPVRPGVPATAAGDAP
jgi:hypothetical protein